MTARIYRPAKTAMQSGKAGTRRWRLEFLAETARRPDPLMGWTSIGDTKAQVRLDFDSKEQAIDYADRHGIDYTLFEPKERSLKIKAYSDNFAWKRVI